MSEDDLPSAVSHSLIDMTVRLVAAYVAHNPLPSAELPRLIADTYQALGGLKDGLPAAGAVAEQATAAQIRKSITRDALISFVDGKPYRTLKRHLTTHGLTLETYRERYGLPKDYPSVAPSYSEARSALARQLGLGQKRPIATVAPSGPAQDSPAPAPQRRKKRPVEAAEA